MIYFFLTLDTRCLSIFLLQTRKTDNNALDIGDIYNLKLKKKYNLLQQTALLPN
jgi:hypothetical protein